MHCCMSLVRFSEVSYRMTDMGKLSVEDKTLWTQLSVITVHENIFAYVVKQQIKYSTAGLFFNKLVINCLYIIMVIIIHIYSL